MKLKKYKLDKNGNPVEEAINELLNWFVKVPVDFELDITETELPSCGTPGCVAGSVASVMIEAGAIDYVPDEKSEMEDWQIGANAMANILGFYDDIHLCQWAKDTPEIWGNQYGDKMFTDLRAYNHTPRKWVSIFHVARHWVGVRHNLRNQSECERAGNQKENRIKLELEMKMDNAVENFNTPGRKYDLNWCHLDDGCYKVNLTTWTGVVDRFTRHRECVTVEEAYQVVLDVIKEYTEIKMEEAIEEFNKNNTGKEIWLACNQYEIDGEYIIKLDRFDDYPTEKWCDTVEEAYQETLKIIKEYNENGDEDRYV